MATRRPRRQACRNYDDGAVGAIGGQTTVVPGPETRAGPIVGELWACGHRRNHPSAATADTTRRVGLVARSEPPIGRLGKGESRAIGDDVDQRLRGSTSHESWPRAVEELSHISTITAPRATEWRFLRRPQRGAVSDYLKNAQRSENAKAAPAAFLYCGCAPHGADHRFRCTWTRPPDTSSAARAIPLSSVQMWPVYWAKKT